MAKDNLKTSYVEVQLIKIIIVIMFYVDLKTSYVEVQHAGSS